MSLGRKSVFILITIALSLGVCLTLAEIMVRVAGYSQWRYIAEPGRPALHEPHPVLGWKNKKGRYSVPAYSPGEKDFRVTNLADGNRATGEEELRTGPNLSILGCSYTQGWAISDEETYPWKLQARHPTVRVRNYGTGGYSTYQCLLLLERLLAGPDPPDLVFYGFIEDHINRNVAPDQWLRGLSRYSNRSHVDVPYATLTATGELQRHPPERYLALPGREYFATVAFGERLFMKLKTRERSTQGRKVTESLLVEMNALARSKGAGFVVVMLSADVGTKSTLADFFQRHRIDSSDCVYAKTSDLEVDGDRHPNGKMNSLWAECIDRSRGGLIEDLHSRSPSH